MNSITTYVTGLPWRHQPTVDNPHKWMVSFVVVAAAADAAAAAAAAVVIGGQHPR